MYRLLFDIPRTFHIFLHQVQALGKQQSKYVLQIVDRVIVDELMNAVPKYSFKPSASMHT
jgi:hypothetical protein